MAVWSWLSPSGTPAAEEHWFSITAAILTVFLGSAAARRRFGSFGWLSGPIQRKDSKRRRAAARSKLHNGHEAPENVRIRRPPPGVRIAAPAAVPRRWRPRRG